jgi:predicted flavoprotein YhiN
MVLAVAIHLVKPASYAGKGPSGMKAAQERKGEMIREAQGNKELGIKVSSAMRASLDFAVAAVADSRFEMQEEREEAMRDAFLRFKAWYLAQWAETVKSLDVPF